VCNVALRRIHETSFVVGNNKYIILCVCVWEGGGVWVSACACRSCLYVRVCPLVRVCEFAGLLACACAHVASLTQHAKRMHRIILSSVASLAPSHFSILSDKLHDFERKGFRKKLKYQILSKSIQLEPSRPMRKDGQTDIHDEANSRFSQFC
jgi:hypothetical protein